MILVQLLLTVGIGAIICVAAWHGMGLVLYLLRVDKCERDALGKCIAFVMLVIGAIALLFVGGVGALVRMALGVWK